MQGMIFEERSANGGESLSGSSQEQTSAEGCSQQSSGGLSSPHSSSYGVHSSPGAQSWVSPGGVVNSSGSPMNVLESPSHDGALADAGDGDDSELSLNATRMDESEDVSNRREGCVAVLCFDRES
jgi:hypothetical protein